MNIKWLTRSIIGIGIVSTVMYLSYLGLWNEPFSGSTIFTIAWFMWPYMVWAFINEFRHNSFPNRRLIYTGFAIAIPLIGLGMLVYVTSFPDAQGGFFLLYIPFLQIMCLGVAWAVCKK